MPEIILTVFNYAVEFSDGASLMVDSFPRGSIKPFNDYVFSNRVGRIGLVETDFGFHVIKVVAKEDVVLVGTIGLKNIPSDRTSDSIFNIASKFEIDLGKSFDINKTADLDFELNL